MSPEKAASELLEANAALQEQNVALCARIEHLESLLRLVASGEMKDCSLEAICGGKA